MGGRIVDAALYELHPPIRAAWPIRSLIYAASLMVVPSVTFIAVVGKVWIGLTHLLIQPPELNIICRPP